MMTAVAAKLPLILLTLLLAMPAFAARRDRETAPTAPSAPWAVPDAPYRAVVRAEYPTPCPETGYAIEIPEFGHTLPNLADCVLTDADGKLAPLYAVWRGEGQRVIFLAKEMKRNANYYLYFGSSKTRRGETWQPRVSLLMETRRLPSGARFDNWFEKEKTWRRATEVDGAGFVPRIFHAANPFGDTVHFVTHYTGWMRTRGMKSVYLYTQSSDASFVTVNGRFELEWGGIHDGRANQKTVHGQLVKVADDLVKVDYYHVKANPDQPPGMVLGWQQGKVFEPVPENVWLRPEQATLVGMESASGRPVPLGRIEFKSYVGFENQFLFETRCALPHGDTKGWTVNWQFDDGCVSAEPVVERVTVGMTPLRFRVTLQREKEELRGIRRIDFGLLPRMASINDAKDLDRYVELMGKQDPATLSVRTLRAYTTLLQLSPGGLVAAKCAGVFLQKHPDPNDPLWVAAQLLRLRGLMQLDPKLALSEMAKLDVKARQQHYEKFDLLELELLVFYLRSEAAVNRARQIAKQHPDSQLARIAMVRVGDFYRLQGRMKEAVAQYQSVQQKATDETGGKKLPAQDRAFSIAVSEMLLDGQRIEAEEKLLEWEAVHPMVKLDSDFLLLRGRTLMAGGRWREALAELDSMLQLQPDSAYQIDINFHRARALYELGQKPKARRIWTEIAKKYPRHEFAAQSSKWAVTP
jgi:tetratricopeptide (TPR) repeat protein